MAEGARLEIVCRGNSTEGSNPSLSAIFAIAQDGVEGGFLKSDLCIAQVDSESQLCNLRYRSSCVKREGF